MNQKTDAPPAVVLKGMADFDTTEAWEEDLVKRITDHISWEVNHPPYESKYEIDQDVELKSFDAEKVDRLLLGQAFVGGEDDYNADYRDDQDREVIKEESVAAFDLFASEIEALAEETDRDVDDLQEEWLESDEFSPSEMECHVHYEKIKYTGEVAARAELPFNLTLDTTGDHLWDSLEFFRINPADFLAAAQKDISDLADEDAGKITENSLDALQKWSFSPDDIQEAEEGEDPPEQNAAAIYTEKFLARQEEIQSTRLYSLNKWVPGESAVSPDALIAYVKEHAYGKDNSITTYLQLCLDGSTVSGFSTRCHRHDFHNDQLPVTVLSGYLTNESSPGYSDDYLGNIKLDKPVTLNVGLISVDQSNTPERGSDTLMMPPALELYADLYEVLVLERKSHGPLELSDPNDQKRLEKAIGMLEGQPRLVVASALTHGDLAGFKVHAQEFMAKGATMFDQDDLDRSLVAKLADLTPGVIQPAEAKEIELLVSMGARGDFVNTEGANALHLAARRLVPLPMLNSIGQVTDLKHAEIEGQGNAFSLTLTALSYKGIASDDESKQALTQRLSWLLDQGIGLTSGAVVYPKPGELATLARLDNGVMVVAALKQFAPQAPAEEIQRIKDKMFYNAAIAGNDSLAGHLMAAGARVDAVSRTLAKPCSLEEAVDQFAIVQPWDKQMPERLNAIKAMARSARLRNSAMSLIEEMENDTPAPASMRP